MRIPPCGWWKLPPATDSVAAAPGLTRVTPTRRLAHHLRARHDEECLSRGLEVWTTPDIVTWDELVERMFAIDRQAGRMTGRWLSATAAQIVWERIVRDDPRVESLLLPKGVARVACQSWRRMHEYGMPVGALGDAGSPESDVFADWCGRYEQWLAEGGFVDAALAAQRVHALAAIPGIEIVGFDRLTPAQESLIARLVAAGVDVRRRHVDAPQAQACRVACLDAAGEIEAAARWAASRLHDSNEQRIAIVVPDLARSRNQVRRIVERVLVPASGLTAGPAPESAAFEIAAARPLAEQPGIAAVLDLLEAFIGWPDLPALSRLLRNPFLGGAAAEAAARARLDARIRRSGNTGLDLTGLERLAGERGCPTLARVLREGRALIDKWPQKESPSNCTNYIFNLLDTLDPSRSETDSVEYQAQQRFRALVSEFGSCDEFSGRVTRMEALVQLRDLASHVLFEPQELRAPLLLIDPETCAGMHFDALWVCGLEASRWPPPAAPDPFLPQALQIRHGVPRASTGLATEEARATLQRLLRSAHEVILSVPQVESAAPLLPSPLLGGIAAADIAPGWSEPRVARHLWQNRPDLEHLTDARMPRAEGDEASRGGAYLLQLQSACPFRAQAELRLGASALDEVAIGVDAAERGTLLHRALAQLWHGLGDQAGLLALDDGAVRSVVHDAVSAAIAEARRAADGLLRHLLDLEAEWLEARVHEVVAADRARPPFAIAAIEQTCTAHLGGLSLELRPDRVDRLEDGSLAVIDYKTGADAQVRAWLDERPRLPQLPAYVHALGADRVGAASFARLRSGDTGYVGLARPSAQFGALDIPGERGWPKAMDSWEHLLAEWHRRLEALADEYVAGDARLAPDPGRACRYCHLGALCRIGETRSMAAVDGDGDD